VAYKAEIQIGVVGVGQLGLLQKSLNQVANTVDNLNRKKIQEGFNVQNLNTYNKLLNIAVQNINKAAMGSQEELQAVRDLVVAKNNQIAAQKRLNFLIAQAEAAQKRIVATSNAGFGEQGPKAPRSAAGGGGGGRTPGQMFENLALGAGFPLLFGGGPGQVLGGLLGSFVGTGFGGQILGSALGGQLQALGVAANQAGTALQKPIDNFNIIKDRALLASSSQDKYVERLIESGRFIEATAEIQRRYNEVIGREGSANLLELTKATDRLNRAWSELGLQIQAAIAGPLAGFVEWLAGFLQLTNNARRGAAAESQLTPDQRAEIAGRRQALERGRQRGTLFGGLTPQQALREEQAIARRAQELAASNQPRQVGTDFRATETAQLASLERQAANSRPSNCRRIFPYLINSRSLQPP